MDWLSHVQLPWLQSDQDKANFGALVDAIKESKAVSGPCAVVYNTFICYQRCIQDFNWWGSFGPLLSELGGPSEILGGLIN